MFAMFFGSGNLVFPIMVGVKSLSEFPFATVGLILTGVILPFLGLLSMVYYGGDRKAFFKSLGAPAAFVLTFAMLALMGPFGVLPRCVIVAHGGMDLIYPGISPVLFNAFFSIVTGYFAWQRTRIIDKIGAWLTPVLLVSVFALILVGIYHDSVPALSEAPAMASMLIGLEQGYQTMDLLAAFFFSATTVTFIARELNKSQDDKTVERYSLMACLLGALLLTAVYLGFVYLGATYAPVLSNVAPEKLVVVIAQHSLGSFALPIAALVIGLACLTTSIILASLFADFLQKDILQDKMPRSLALIITLVIGYTFSLLGFSELASWIANALVIAYPALIVYAVAKIIAVKTGFKISRELFWLVLLGSIIMKVLHHTGYF
jgi:LIVCS family branched-chain amino acid:cation transporter